MPQALLEAQLAYNRGEIPIGCVIVNRSNNQIISKTHNLIQKYKNPNYHAEILAINDACAKSANKNLSDCDIYVTIEPCTMCASAIANARLSRLYYGASDPKQGAIENGIRFFTSSTCFHRPEIYSDICEEESKLIIKTFFNKIRKNQL